MDHIQLDLPQNDDTALAGAQKLVAAIFTLAAGTNNMIAALTATNVPPVALFALSSTYLAVTVDATSSTDADGTIALTAWDWGDGSTGAGATASHTYAAAGAYKITVTVSDDDGASSSASRTVQLVAQPAPPDPTPTPGAPAPYTNDSGVNPDTGGTQPTGAAFVPWASASGSTDLARFRSVGASKRLALPASTVNVSTFTTNASEAVTSLGGIVGAGSARSTLKQVQDSAPSGAKSNMLRVEGNNLLFQDFTLQGTKQANRASYTGLFVKGSNITGRRVRLVAADPGYDKAPPGETFGLNMLGVAGSLWEDAEIAAEAITGQQAGASLFGPNSCTGMHTFNRCYAHGGNYSAAWAVWQHVGDVVQNDCVFDNCRAFWNCERNTGTWTVNRPRIGKLKSATSGWGGTSGGNVQAARAVVAETDKTWHDAHPGGFLFKIVDPRNLDGTPYSGPKLDVQFIGGNDGTPNLYGRSNFKAFDASGNDISSSLFNFLSAGGVGV